MQKPPISFRLTDRELEALEREQQPQESINQTAARLLRERLGILSVDGEYTLESTTLSNWISDTVNSKLETVQLALDTKMVMEIEKLSHWIKEIELNVVESSTRIDSVESRLPKPRAKKLAS